MSFIELNQVGKFYESHRVLADVNLNFSLNEFVSIIGQSGCGKTTLLNIIGLIEENSEGKIKINGKNISKRRKNYYRYNFFSYVYQNYELVDYLTIKENILLNIHNIDEDLLNSLVERFNCVGLLDKYPEELSGGEKQRISIIRALVKNPRVIICDEPTGQLDSKNSELIMKYLKENNEGKLILIATHNIDLAKKYSTRIIHIGDGCIVDDNKLENVKELDQAEELHSYRSNKKSIFKQSLKFLKTTRWVPPTIISLFAIILTVLSSIIGLHTGVNDYINCSKYERLDSDYFEMSFYKDNLELSAHDSITRILDNLGVNYVEFYNYSYLFNNLFYNAIRSENDLNFDFEISVIDLSSYECDAICNSLFQEKKEIEKITLNSNIQILEYQINPKIDITINKVNNESSIYNTPKLYLSYEYVDNLFSNDFKEYFFLQDEIIVPNLFFIKNNLNDIYDIFSDAKYMTSYVKAATQKSNSYVVYTSSSVIIYETLSDLTDSISLSLVMISAIILILIFTIFSLTTKHLLLKRRKELAVLYSYGCSVNDMRSLIFSQNILLLLPSLILSSLIYYGLHYFVYEKSNLIIGKNFDILAFDIKSIITSVYIILLIAIISSFKVSSEQNMNMLKEELHDE